MQTKILGFIKFLYIDSANLFIRLWKNIIGALEEDLAVELMIRLLFVPLFHDASYIGRALSICFRTVRIFFGFLAFVFATFGVLLLSLVWYAWPAFVFLPDFGFVFLIVPIIAITIYLVSVIPSPPKKLSEINSPQNLWQSTKLKKANVTWLSLLNNPEVSDLLFRLELTPDEFKEFNPSLTDSTLQKVYDLARENNLKYISEGYFFLALLCEIPNIDNILLQIQLALTDFEAALKFIELRKKVWKKTYLWDEDYSVSHLKGVNRGWLNAPTPILNSVSRDLTSEMSNSDMPEFVGRNEVIRQLIEILSANKNRNALIIGPPGAGKTLLVKLLAWKIIQGNAPASLATKRVVELDLSKLLIGVQNQGDLAAKVNGLFEEVKYIQNIIIFVDDVENLGIGEAGQSFNLYAMMLPYLESYIYQFIAATSGDNYAKIIEKNPSFSRIFNKVELPAANLEESEEFLIDLSLDVEKTQNIHYSLLALKEIVKLSNRFIHDRVLPDSALSIFHESQGSGGNKNQAKLITVKEIKEIISRRVSIPLMDLGTASKEQLLNLEAEIHQRLIDQEPAVKAVSNSLRRAAVSLRDEDRPIGSFLFVGPTGVGKTELAKTLSDVYFKNQGHFFRLDMSEYQTTESINRLIGTETNPGILTETITRQPFTLLLLDEFEKADPKLLTLFLQVLDDGRLTDYSGKLVDFTNTIIIATSNAASITIAKGLAGGQTIDEIKPVMMEELLHIFKPELLNRFDDVVVFKPLSQSDLLNIVKNKLVVLQKRMKDQGYLLSFEMGLVTELAKRGFDPVLGARPLRRLIQDTIEARLSILILEGKLNKGQNFSIGSDLLN